MLARTELLHRSKLILNSGLVEEINFWRVEKSEYYPEGIKYRLRLLDPFWKKALLVVDNNSPKGHIRQDSTGTEFSYKFISAEELVKDFLTFRLREEKKYENHEN